MTEQGSERIETDYERSLRVFGKVVADYRAALKTDAENNGPSALGYLTSAPLVLAPPLPSFTIVADPDAVRAAIEEYGAAAYAHAVAIENGPDDMPAFDEEGAVNDARDRLLALLGLAPVKE